MVQMVLTLQNCYTSQDSWCPVWWNKFVLLAKAKSPQSCCLRWCAADIRSAGQPWFHHCQTEGRTDSFSIGILVHACCIQGLSAGTERHLSRTQAETKSNNRKHVAPSLMARLCALTGSKPWPRKHCQDFGHKLTLRSHCKLNGHIDPKLWYKKMGYSAVQCLIVDRNICSLRWKGKQDFTVLSSQ